jgi:hypothetical protein
MEQLGSHWTDFQKMLYLTIFRKSVLKIQVSLKLDEIKRYFTWRLTYIAYHTSLISSENEKYFRLKLHRKSKHILCWVTFFSKACRLWDNVEKYCSWEGHRWQRGACALHAGFTHTRARARRLCKIHCLSTSTIFARKRLNVTLNILVYCLFCLFQTKSFIVSIPKYY